MLLHPIDQLDNIFYGIKGKYEDISKKKLEWWVMIIKMQIKSCFIYVQLRSK